VAFAARVAAARKVLDNFARVAELPRRRERIARLTASLTERTLRFLERRRERLSQDAAKLEILSPLAILARGYAVAFREGARAPLLSASEVRTGERIRVRLHEGELKAVVGEASRVPSPESRVPAARRAPAAPKALPLFDFLFEEEPE
jgi:exodeoxyribonuclease VII large subunit